MSRVRLPETLVAGLATLVVSWPLTTLFTPNTWVRPTVLMVAVVVAGGLLGRAVSTSKTVVLLVQLALVTLAAGGLYGRGHLWHGLPTLDMVLAFNNILVEARETVQSYSAPAPTTRGVTLGIGLALALTSIVVDHLAVMRRSPALAGLPLLTAFLISASNSGSALHPGYFVAAAAVWLVMVGRQGTAALRRWSTTTPLATQGRRDDSAGALGFAALGRWLGLGALVAALMVPGVVPHLPTRYLVDGLGRADDATGFSDGQIGLTSTLDLERSLEDRSLSPVLSYTTTATVPTPLRVGVLDSYRGDEWVPDRVPVDFSRRTTVSLPPELDPGVPRERHRISVDGSRLEAPQIAAPSPLAGAELDVPWGVEEGTGVVRVGRSAESYSMDYAELEPDQSLLEQPPADVFSDANREGLLRLDQASADTVLALAREVVPDGSSRIEAALAIQEHLRGTAYTYSLTLAGPVEDEQGRLVQYDPITHFLKTRTGYCVQFATAMVMMARASGIPARMAIGFLPGTLERGVYTVRAADAHAWPELYFDGVGWLRFEPTPAARSGQAPPYSLEEAPTTGEGSEETAGPSASATTSVRRDSGANDPGAQDPVDPSDATNTGALARWWASGRLTAFGWITLGVLGGALGAVAVPLAARARLRRRLRGAADDAHRVEVEWQAMVERIGDLGVVPPSGSTPRQAGQVYQREAYLEGPEVESLRRVVHAVESARYAPPGATLLDIREDAHRVVGAVSAVRRRRDRVRALLLPQEGLAEWRDRRAQVAAAVRRPWDAVRARLERR